MVIYLSVFSCNFFKRNENSIYCKFKLAVNRGLPGLIIHIISGGLLLRLCTCTCDIKSIGNLFLWHFPRPHGHLAFPSNLLFRLPGLSSYCISNTQPSVDFFIQFSMCGVKILLKLLKRLFLHFS